MAPAVGDGFEEYTAVIGPYDSRIQHHDDAAVFAAADEPADTLAEFQHCFGQKIVAEGIAAIHLNLRLARGDQRMSRHLKGQLDDDNVAARLARCHNPRT